MTSKQTSFDQSAPEGSSAIKPHDVTSHWCRMLMGCRPLAQAIIQWSPPMLVQHSDFFKEFVTHMWYCAVTNETFIAHLSAELGLLHDKAEAFCLPRETIFMPLLVSIRYSVGTSTQGLAPPAATEGSNYLRAGSWRTQFPVNLRFFGQKINK